MFTEQRNFYSCLPGQPQHSYFSPISKLPVTVSLFGLKHFLLFKSTECKTNNGFNWSIIVSRSGAEVGKGARWIWNNDDDDDDNYPTTNIVIRPSILLSHPITSPKKLNFHPPAQFSYPSFLFPLRSPEKTQSLKLLFHSKQMRITKFDQMKNEIQYFLTTLGLAQRKGAADGEQKYKPFIPRLDFTLA